MSSGTGRSDVLGLDVGQVGVCHAFPLVDQARVGSSHQGTQPLDDVIDIVGAHRGRDGLDHRL